MTALGVDFAVGGSVKWLCGGPANGWLYVRPDLAERLEPAYTGWQAHERPFAFEEEMEYASGSVRFLTGTPNPAAHMAGSAGYDLIEEIGVERIRANSLRQTQLLIELADAAGLEVYSRREPERRGGAVIVAAPEGAAVYAGTDPPWHPGRLPAGCRDPARPALFHGRRTLRCGRPDRGDRRDGRLAAARWRRRAALAFPADRNSLARVPIARIPKASASRPQEPRVPPRQLGS